MNLTAIEIEKFKKARTVRINLDPINVIIGGNNAGKSSVLQGIHFSVAAAVAAKRLDKQTFTQENLLYCPTRNFVTLRNGAGYQNQSNFGYLRVWAETDEGDEASYDIRMYRGRNEGNVGCSRSGNANLGSLITDFNPPFSIYVPGLAGIPQSEEFRSESVIRKGVASGDANLYLRNVLHLIKKKSKAAELTRLMRSIFPEFTFEIKFDPVHDSFIDVLIKLERTGEKKHIELVGTGVLQALQIFSYVTLFQPKLLLLDEPDSHLHPDNQCLLAEALVAISSVTNTKIIISTHSRHLVDALYDDANFIWLKEGQVYQQGRHLHRLSMLMDIGALDSYDKLREGLINYVVLTEDSNKDMIETLLDASGFPVNETIVYSYKTSANLNAAHALTEFIKEIAPETTIIVHADNDFLTDEEQRELESKISQSGAIPFVTEGSDIESYFIQPLHLARLLEVTQEEIEEWLDGIAESEHNQLMHKFSRKRDDAKFKLYKRREDQAPDTLRLMGNDIPLANEKRLGKFMFKKVRAGMHEKFGKTVDLKTITPELKSDRLIAIKNA